MRISDWSSDVCSSDLARPMTLDPEVAPRGGFADAADYRRRFPDGRIGSNPGLASVEAGKRFYDRSEEHTSELQSLMRHSYGLFCLKKKEDPNTTMKLEEEETNRCARMKYT